MPKKRVLLTQLRPEDAASDNEFEKFLEYSGLQAEDVHRVRMDQGELPDIDLSDYSAVVVPGGPWDLSNPTADKSEEQQAGEKWLHKLIARVIARDFPYYGECYGFTNINKCLGGIVNKDKYAEGVDPIHITLNDAAMDDPLLQGIPSEFVAYGGHKESCQNLPEPAVLLASSPNCPYHMLRVKNNIYATQFHGWLDLEGICLRIDIYKGYGYFPADEAESLKALAATEEVRVPMVIFRRFIDKYCQ